MVPPAVDREAQAELKAAVQRPPREVGLDPPDWNWKGVREFVAKRFDQALALSSCLGPLHRLGFVLKRPKKRLLKANAAKRAAVVVFYQALCAEAERTGALIFFAEEAIWDWARQEVTRNVCLGTRAQVREKAGALLGFTLYS